MDAEGSLNLILFICLLLLIFSFWLFVIFYFHLYIIRLSGLLELKTFLP